MINLGNVGKDEYRYGGSDENATRNSRSACGTDIGGFQCVRKSGYWLRVHSSAEDGIPAIFNFPALEHEEVTVAESGNIDANCKVDLGKGAQTTLNNANTGFTCSLTGSSGITPTTDWQEVISASGQTTLQCHFHP